MPREARPSRWQTLGLISLVLGGAAGIRIWMQPLEISPDAAVYAQHAWNLAHGGLDIGDDAQYVHRFPVYALTALAYRLRGLSQATTIVVPLLLSLLQVLLALLLARRIAGAGAGYLAGILLATLPLDVIASSQLLADLPFGALISASLVAWWFAADERSGSQGGRAFAVVAGLCLALAALIRTYAFIVLPLFALDAACRRSSVRLLPFLLTGVVLVVLPVFWIYAQATGDALLPLRVVRHVYGEGQFVARIDPLYYPAAMLNPRGVLALCGWFFLICIGSVILRPQPDRLRLLVWVAGIGGFLQFGSMSLTDYLPMLKEPRFLTPIALPICVFIAVSLRFLSHHSGEEIGHPLRQLQNRRWRAAVLALAFVLIAAASYSSLATVRSDHRPRYRAFAHAARTLGSRPELPVLFDHWKTAICMAPQLQFGGGAGFYHNEDDAVRMTDPLPVQAKYGFVVGYADAAELPHALLVIDERPPHFRDPEHGAGRGPKLPQFVWNRPSDWRLLFEAEDLYVYEVGAGTDSTRPAARPG